MFTAKKIEEILEKKKSTIHKSIDTFIKKIPRYFLWTVELYIPLKILNLGSDFENIIDILFTIVILLQVIRLSSAIFTIALNKLSKSSLDKTSKNALQLIANVIIWMI